MRASVLPIVQDHEVAGAESWKPSLYNHFVESGDVVWGFNFISLALVKLNPRQYQMVRQILEGECVESASHESLQRALIKGKFLIPGHEDEVEQLKTRNRASRFGDHGLSLVIAPTLRCNFTCDYCYVDLNANKMKPEDRVKLGKFFYRKLPEGKSARIIWTGGDPSLAMDVVEDLSLRFLESCEIKKCSYSARLITNGYLLDDRMRAHLRASKVSSLQISLDGSQEFHDSVRCLPNSKPTYDAILRNVADSCDEFEVWLRINVDRRNYEKLPDLLDDLEARGLAPKVFLGYGHVDNVNENSASYDESCLSAREFADAEVALTRLATERGFRMGNRSIPSKPVSAFCGANAVNSYVVDSSVNLLKCYHDFGAADKHGIGRIADDGSELVTNPYNLLKWLGWDPFEISECSQCKVLPICMGGCIHKIVNSGMNFEKGCLKMRFSMDKIIEMVGASSSGDRSRALSGSCGCASAV